MLQFLDPVILFFLIGIIAGLAKSGLKVPKDFYETISIYLLFSIGIRGGIEMYHAPVSDIILPALGTIGLGIGIFFLSLLILFYMGRFDKINALSIAAHYGSVSAVTFAVTISYLEQQKIPYEKFMTSMVVLMEIPAIAVAVLMAKTWIQGKSEKINIKKIFHEVFLGKSVLLMASGLGIGLFIEYSGNNHLNFFFLDLFKGFLALFILEMGIVTAERFRDLKKVGTFLLSFGIIMPIIAAILGIVVGKLVGLSLGGSIVLAAMSASASYIAAPAAMGITVPQANSTYSITAALGITFPFNIIVGIILYHWIAASVFFG